MRALSQLRTGFDLTKSGAGVCSTGSASSWVVCSGEAKTPPPDVPRHFGRDCESACRFGLAVPLGWRESVLGRDPATWPGHTSIGRATSYPRASAKRKRHARSGANRALRLSHGSWCRPATTRNSSGKPQRSVRILPAPAWWTPNCSDSKSSRSTHRSPASRMIPSYSRGQATRSPSRHMS
jgi:hypothetical protein